jgi:hypothetical protein
VTKLCLEKECYLIETGYWINKSKNIFKRNRIIPDKTINLIVQERNNTGVFTTAYRYNIDNIDEAYLFGDLYFDFDSKENFELVREDALRTLAYLKIVFRIEPDDTKIYFSGNKGVHIVVPARILGIEPDKKLNAVFRFIAENVKSFTPNKTLDLVIYDNKRLFRIPNTIHESTGLYKIQIVEKELREFTHEQIKMLAEWPRVVKTKEPQYNQFANAQYKRYIEQYIQESNKKVNVTHKGTLKCTPPCIQHLIDNGAIEGARNISIAVLASFYKNCGVSLDETTNKISDWNERNIAPTKQSELNKTVKSIYLGKSSYGCKTLKEVSECDESKCPLKRKTVK